MATVNYSSFPGTPTNSIDSLIYKWVLAQGDVGQELVLGSLADRSVHIFGTLGGATVTIEGSNEGADGQAAANHKTLNDQFSNALSFAAGLPVVKGVSELVRIIRPKVTGGDGTTAITVFLLAKRQ